MRWMWSRSTISWILVRVCAGTPPESATISSTFRPASVLLRSARYCVSARSMSMPPEASGPVLTVIRPRRIGPACARTGSAVAAAAAPVACMKRLRVADGSAALVVLGDDLSPGRALDVVLAHGALASRRQAVELALRRMQRFPERRGHALAADARDAAIYEHDVNYGNLKAPRVIERRFCVLDDAHRILGLRRHGGYVHVEVAAMHVDGDDGGLGRFQLELPVQPGDET